MPSSPGESMGGQTRGSRLDSWKEIAAYLNRHVTTVRRWERHEGLPVHRHHHDKLGSVYAFRDEIDRWWHSRRARLEQETDERSEGAPAGEAAGDGAPPDVEAAFADGTGDPLPSDGCPPPSMHVQTRRRRVLLTGTALGIVGAAAFVGWAARPEPATPAAGPGIASIAVLPLENLSADPDQEYFADGMTEALTIRLAQMRALTVVSRTSVMRFKRTTRPLPEIARTLRVDAVLQGSVQRFGNRVRIAVQLIHGGTDTHLWARTYEREWSDVLKLQAEVAAAVGHELRIQVTPEERTRIASTASVDPAAHQEYLIGRYYLWRDEEESLKRAIAHFERATQIDPAYAAAFAGLSHAWWSRGMFGAIGREAAELPAREAARRALTLDGGLAEAYVVQADIRRIYDRDLAGAEHLVLRALALDPQNVDAHYTYALVLMALGRFPDAIAHIESAEQRDPLSPAIQSDFGRILYRARRYDQAVPRLLRALELEPKMRRIVHSRLADVYEQMGRYRAAMSALETLGSDNSFRSRRARIHALMGNTEEAKRLLAAIRNTPGDLPLREMAAAYAALGDRDEAFALLAASIDRRDGGMFVAVDPPFDSLHSDPRWPELLRRLNHPVQMLTAVRWP